MKHHFLTTGNKRLTEASPLDPVWGIGLRADDPRAKDPPLAWVVGSGIVRPEINAPHWVQRAGFGQLFIASAQKVMLHGGVLREFDVVAR